MKYFFFLLIGIITLGSCGETGNVLKGTFINAENLNVYFDQYDPVTNTNNMLAKSETNSSGNFTIDLPEKIDPGIYRVRIGTKAAYLVLDKISQPFEIHGDLERIEKRADYQVNGSVETQEFQAIMNKYVRREINSQHLVYYVENNATPLVGYLIANIAMKSSSFASAHASVAKKLAAQYPNLDITPTYQKYVSDLQGEFARQQAAGKIKVGEMAPDLELPGPDGKVYKLSDMKGQVVLLDFWASWCGPCRKANPKVVQTYNKYKKDGFNVFSVSLDGVDEKTKKRSGGKVDDLLQRSKERWVAAIKQDKLTWDAHVSDLKKWDSMASATYDVRSIPKTFLIDREGKIAVINPRYNLEAEVLKYL